MIALAALLLLAVPDDGAPPPQAPPPSDQIYELHLAVDIPVIVAGGSVGLVRALFEEKLARKSCPCDPSGLNPLDRRAVGNHSHAASIAADVTVYGTMALLPLADLLDLGVRRALLEDLVVYAETLTVDTALQNAVNFAVARPRPRSYAGDPAFLNTAEGYVSFYAGHVATAFSALSAASFTLQRRHGAGVWPWIVTGVIGGSVAVERVASGHHFPTDVAVAALAGTAIGVTVPWLHTGARTAHLTIAPAAGGQGLALAGAF